MAGDWIKYREGLVTHPKLLGLANILIYSEDLCAGFRDFCLPSEAQTDGDPSSDLLQTVTTKALRRVILTLLLDVWGAVNQHGKPDGDDAVMTPMGLGDIDDITGVVGFGAAMEKVGWVEESDDDNTLIFPGFINHNEPASMRKKPLSNAERQRRYRAKKKADQARTKPPKRAVTESNGSNDREEKRRVSNIPIGDGTYPQGSRQAASPTLLSKVEDTYEPSEEMIQRIGINGLTKYHTQTTLSKFILHYQATGALLADWDAKYLAWLINERSYGMVSAGTGKGGGGKPAWASMPRNDENLTAWAAEHGYPQPGKGEGYPQYRGRLQAAVEKRRNEEDQTGAQKERG